MTSYMEDLINNRGYSYDEALAMDEMFRNPNISQDPTMIRGRNGLLFDPGWQLRGITPITSDADLRPKPAFVPNPESERIAMGAVTPNVPVPVTVSSKYRKPIYQRIAPREKTTPAPIPKKAASTYPSTVDLPHYTDGSDMGFDGTYSFDNKDAYYKHPEFNSTGQRSIATHGSLYPEYQLTEEGVGKTPDGTYVREPPAGPLEILGKDEGIAPIQWDPITQQYYQYGYPIPKNNPIYKQRERELSKIQDGPVATDALTYGTEAAMGAAAYLAAKYGLLRGAKTIKNFGNVLKNWWNGKPLSYANYDSPLGNMASSYSNTGGAAAAMRVGKVTLPTPNSLSFANTAEATRFYRYLLDLVSNKQITQEAFREFMRNLPQVTRNKMLTF